MHNLIEGQAELKIDGHEDRYTHVTLCENDI